MTLICGVRVHLDTFLTETEQLTDTNIGAFLHKLMRTQTRYNRLIPVSYVSERHVDEVQRLIAEHELPVPTLIAAGNMLVVSNDRLSSRSEGNDYVNSRESGINEYSMINYSVHDQYNMWNDGKESIVQRQPEKVRLSLEEGLADILRQQNYYDRTVNSVYTFPIYRDGIPSAIAGIRDRDLRIARLYREG